MSNKKIIPNTRVDMFYSDEDFSLEIEMGREYSEGDVKMTVILYRVDRTTTESDDIYNEAGKDDIRFEVPVELKVTVNFQAPENKTYNEGSGSLRYMQDGIMTFGIYDSQLSELDADITYGDYIGYPVSETEIRYFSVTNDGRKNYDNPHTFLGYKGAYRSIVAAPVDQNEFNGV